MPPQTGPIAACQRWNTPCTIATRWSLFAAASACPAKKINISNSLAGQRLGLKEGDDAIWLVSFMDYDLGDIGLEQKTLQPLDNPPRPLVSPMGPEHFVTHIFGMDPDFVGAARGTRTPDPLITNQVLYQLSYGGAGERGDSTAQGALST